MNALRTLLMSLGVAMTFFVLLGCGGGGGGGAPEAGGGVLPQPGQALQVVATTPAAGDEGAALQPEIAITFARQLDDAMLPNPPVIVRQDGIVVPGTLDHEQAAGTLRFTPTAPFQHLASIEVTAQAGIMDVEGNEMTADYAFDFTARLPRLSAAQTAIATGRYSNARHFKMNPAGQGILIYVDGHPVEPGQLMAVHYQMPQGRVSTVPLDAVRNLRLRERSLAIAANGDIVLAWIHEEAGQRDAYVRLYDASTDSWANRVSLEISPAHEPTTVEAAISPTGDVLIAWNRAPLGSNDHDRLMAKTYIAGAGWGGTFSIDAGTGLVGDPIVAMGRGGHGIVTWREEGATRSRVRAETWSASAGWGPEVPIDTQAPYDVTPHAAAVDDQGRITVLYEEERASLERTMWALRYIPVGLPNSGWGSPTRLDDDYAFVGSGQAGVDEAGHVTLAWGNVASTEGTLRARRFHLGTGWQPLHVFAPTAVIVGHGIHLDVAPDGTVALGARARPAAQVRRILCATWSPASSGWSPANTVDDNVYDHIRPMAVRAWRDGVAYVSWAAPAPIAGSEPVRLRGAWLNADGLARPIDEISGGLPEGGHCAGFDLDRQGRGAVVWTEARSGLPREADILERLID